MSPRVREDIVHPRLQSGASTRPLNFTVRSPPVSRARLFAFTLTLSVTANAAPGEASLAVQFDAAPIVVLAQVEESSFPKAYHSVDDEDRFRDASATLLVITSWKGPYHSGATIRAVQPQICTGYRCLTYPFQVGEIVVVFAMRQWGEPISAPAIRAPDARTMTQLYFLSWGGEPNNRWRGP